MKQLALACGAARVRPRDVEPGAAGGVDERERVDVPRAISRSAARRGGGTGPRGGARWRPPRSGARCGHARCRTDSCGRGGAAGSAPSDGRASSSGAAEARRGRSASAPDHASGESGTGACGPSTRRMCRRRSSHARPGSLPGRGTRARRRDSSSRPRAGAASASPASAAARAPPARSPRLRSAGRRAPVGSPRSRRPPPSRTRPCRRPCACRRATGPPRVVTMKNWLPLVSGPGVGHRQRAAHDLVLVELVLERVARAAGAGALRAAALDHEVLDHPVEDQPVVEAVAGQLAEVLDRLGRVLVEAARARSARGWCASSPCSCPGHLQSQFHAADVVSADLVDHLAGTRPPAPRRS